VDPLKRSKNASMKELQFNAADAAWRAALLLTQSAKRLFSSPATNQARAQRDFTGR